MIIVTDSSTRSSAREQEEDNLISLLNSSRKVGTEVFGPGAGHEHRESVTSGRIYPQKLSEAGYPKFIWVQTNCDESSFRLRTYADKSCHFANSLDFPMNQVAGLEFNNSAFDRTYSNLVHNAYGPWTPINSDVNSASSECSLPSIDIQVAPVISDLAETMSLSHIYDNLKSSPPKPGSGNTGMP